MIERIVENWLINASERSFQLPFCYLLQNQGHKILHLTRHRPIEFGKDVITQHQDGSYHAFQLKKGNLNQSSWRQIIGQLTELCYQNIAHPHVPKLTNHIPYLVTNGNIDEEVYRAIEDFNANLETIGKPKLNILKFDDLYNGFLELGTRLWPSELSDYKRIIEFALLKGDSIFPTDKLISLLESQLEINTNKNIIIRNIPSAKRSITSAAMLTSYCVSNYLDKENHVAIIEAWITYIASMKALISKMDLDNNLFFEEYSIAKLIVFQSLENLSDELDDRQDLFEGNFVLDMPFYHYRTTRVIGFISALYLWRLSTGEEKNQLVRVSAIIKRFIHDCKIISESHIPYLLVTYWAIRQTDATQIPLGFLKNIIDTILDTSKYGNGLPSPYYLEKDILPIYLQNILKSEIDPAISIGLEPIDDNFEYTSFYLDGLVQLFARYNYKQEMRFLWPDISRFCFKYFQVEHEWHFFRYRNENAGKEKSYLPNLSQSWAKLREQASTYDPAKLPRLLTDDPIFSLLFLLIYPHRVNPDYLKYLDTEFRIKLRQV